jgi:S-adenosylmethionine decarboxylase
MSEYTKKYYEIISHVPLQYLTDIYKTDEINIIIIESGDNILKEIKKYNIINIIKLKNINELNFTNKIHLIIFEQNNNITNDVLNKLINNADIIIIPDLIIYNWSYFNFFRNDKQNNTEIICENKYKIYKSVNFYSKKFNPTKYFLKYKLFNELNISCEYYHPNNHFKYFNIEHVKKPEKIIMGAHIMLDFDKVDFNVLENIEYIKHLMNNIAVKENFVVLNTTCHRFEPIGFTMLFLLSTSHFSIHTYPEHNKCSIDLYSCDMNVNYNNVIEMLKLGLKSDSFNLHQVIREI